ncbi:hypothetical protein N7462_009290 [Penicillium macrosclerotiorum]|uniref:uncharacterized protein n=1 Tax=Penicillium macrosclerotiorum TaxID=303699 RepID=UPI00254795D4|nr:uncharacterized protein N7462_009290 [Penicillium macrosclerotiorum]KAJ5673851.1 hypothetical protein N7462_009290 [Penicillium macrosclerotiorum]
MQKISKELSKTPLFRQRSKFSMKPDSLVATTKSTYNPSLSSVNLRNSFAIIAIPLGAIISLPWVHLHSKTLLFGVFYAYIRSFAIVSGYHRLWAHRTYNASTTLKIIFAILGAGAGQDHIKKWARDHRAHHRYVDTNQDPYNIKQGFFYAHMGWIIFEDRKARTTGPVDISDLNSDRIVQWQKKYFVPLFLIMGYLVPSVICGISHGDFLGGFIYAGCLGTAIQQQLTFCVNSVAHWLGDQPYTATKSARQSPWAVTIFLMGEGYHNYHHEFPGDYRTGIRWYDFDPGKWCISLFYFLGLATNLKRFPQNEVDKTRLQRKCEEIEKEGEAVDWGVPLDELPVWKWEEYAEQTRTGRNLIVIRGAVHDVSAFASEHPGGPAMIAGAVGKDATEMFEGGIYGHSNAASNLLDRMRIAVIKDI